MCVWGIVWVPVIWTFLADDEKQGVFNFFNPTRDIQGTGWNLSQALIAIGSGKIFGRGLGHGPQSQLNFIPEKHTDFIFAVMAEELGFLITILFMVTFGFLIWRCFKIALESRDAFGSYLAIGIGSWLGIQGLINIMSMTGLMPMTGVTLPFISHGGTSMAVLLGAMGIVASIPRHAGRSFGFRKKQRLLK